MRGCIELIKIKIPFTNDSFFLYVEFDGDFKSNILFIKEQFLGWEWDDEHKRWNIPYYNFNVRKARAFSFRFSNIEELDELDTYESAPYFVVRDLPSSKELVFAYDPALIQIIKSNIKYPKDKGFNQIAKTWTVSNETWDKLKYDIWEHLEGIGENYKFPAGEDFEAIESIAKSRSHAHYHLTDEQFWELAFTVKGEYPYLREYQARDVVKYSTTLHILNANEMGLGKTIETLTYISMEKPQKVLIIVPASLKDQWYLEMEKFTPHLTDRTYVISGNVSKREKIWKKCLDLSKFIIITNYANLRTKDYIKFHLDHIQFDLIVFDEITRCKHQDTQTFKLCDKLLGIKKIGLTGTPIENHLTDIFNIMKIIHPTFFGSFSQFAHKYLRKGGYQNRQWLEKPGSAQEIAQELKEFFGWIRWNRKQVLKELPEIMFNTFRVKLNSNERDIYWKIREKLMHIYNKEGKLINTKNILALITALRRICSDPQIYDINLGDSSKKKEFVRVVKENVNGRKILVFSQYKDCIQLYSKALENKGISNMVITGDTPMNLRDKIISDFENSTRIKVLLCTDTFTYGKNLQMCSMLINIDQHFNPAIMKQRIGRIHRIGQKAEKINVINFLVQDSIEEFVFEKMMRKEVLFQTVIQPNEFKPLNTIREYLRQEATT